VTGIPYPQALGRLERLARDKYTSLFCPFVMDEEKQVL